VIGMAVTREGIPTHVWSWPGNTADSALLVRVIETTCEESWPNLRRELEQLKLGSFRGPSGTFRQRTEITAPQRAILAKLQLAEPPRLQEITPAAAASSSPPTSSAHRYTPLLRANSLLPCKTATFRGLLRGSAAEPRVYSDVVFMHASW